MDQKRAGLIQFKVNGEIYDAKGAFKYGFGRPKRTAIMGSDRVHGYKEEPRVAFIEGAITDRNGLDLAALFLQTGVTVTIEAANGKTFALRDGWYAGDDQVDTGEAEIAVRWEGASGEEI